MVQYYSWFQAGVLEPIISPEDGGRGARVTEHHFLFGIEVEENDVEGNP